MVKERVQLELRKASEEVGIGALELTRPREPKRGDFAVYVEDRDQASRLAEKISEKSIHYSARAEGSFVNITVHSELWHEELRRILSEKESYADLKIGDGEKVNVEFISANPTGELHVGNGRGAFYGDVLANIFSKTGYNVEREFYIDDAKVSKQIQELGRTALGKGETYKTSYLEKVIESLSGELEQVHNEGEAGYIVAHKVIEDIRIFVNEKLNISFDTWFSEESLFKNGKIQNVKKNLPIYEKDGACWVSLQEATGVEDQVVVRSTGEPGYFLSDMAYHKDKSERADVLIDVWGADHQGHVKRLMAAGALLGFAEKLHILITQIVHLKEGGVGKKMSKRSGDVVPLGWIIDEVGVDAARYFYLSKSLSTHMDFDVSLAKEQSQKNPVYYVQYSYARSNQIFEKAKEYGGEFDEKANLSLLESPHELSLIKKLTEYPEILESIVTGYKRSESYDVHKLTTYVHDLATTFHKFYENCYVVEEGVVNQPRLALVKAYQIILGDVLSLLGISAPEKM